MKRVFRGRVNHFKVPLIISSMTEYRSAITNISYTSLLRLCIFPWFLNCQDSTRITKNSKYSFVFIGLLLLSTKNVAASFSSSLSFWPNQAHYYRLLESCILACSPLIHLSLSCAFLGSVALDIVLLARLAYTIPLHVLLFVLTTYCTCCIA